MSAPIISAIIGVAGIICGGIITAGWSSRTARRVAAQHDGVETTSLQVNVWQQQYEAWKSDALALREQRDEDQRLYQQDRNRFENILAERGRQMDEMVVKMHDMEARITTMTRERAEEQVYLEALVAWCRVVVKLLRKAGIAYPPLPEGVSNETDPRGFQAQRG